MYGVIFIPVLVHTTTTHYINMYFHVPEITTRLTLPPSVLFSLLITACGFSGSLLISLERDWKRINMMVVFLLYSMSW